METDRDGMLQLLAPREDRPAPDRNARAAEPDRSVVRMDEREGMRYLIYSSLLRRKEDIVARLRVRLTWQRVIIEILAVVVFSLVNVLVECCFHLVVWEYAHRRKR